MPIIKALERLLGWFDITINTAHFLTNHWFLSLFSSKVQWFLLQKLHMETTHITFFFEIEWLVRSLQELPKSFVLFPIATFVIFITEPLWRWSRIGSRVKISHYIQPSILSNALIPIVFILTCVTRSGLVNGSSTTSISVSASRSCWRTWRTPWWLGSNLGSVGQHDPAWIVWSFVVTRITRAPRVNRVTRRTSLSLKKWISNLLIRNSLRTILKRLLVFKAGQDRNLHKGLMRWPKIAISPYKGA